MKERLVAAGNEDPNKPFQLSIERKRMALFPFHPARVQVVDVVNDPGFWVPVVRIQSETNKNSLQIFPGIPSLFERMLHSFFQQVIVPLDQSTFHRVVVGTSGIESEIAAILTDIQHQATCDGILYY